MQTNIHNVQARDNQVVCTHRCSYETVSFKNSMLKSRQVRDLQGTYISTCIYFSNVSLFKVQM